MTDISSSMAQVFPLCNCGRFTKSRQPNPVPDNAESVGQRDADTEHMPQEQTHTPNQANEIVSASPLETSRYRHALALLLPSFPALKDTLKGAIALKTADCLIRDDASEFLLDQIHLWDGPWHDSYLPRLSSDNSVTDRLVQICRRLEILSRLQPTDGLSLRFHSILHFQLYRRYEQATVKENVPKSKGTKVSSIALDRLLGRLYEDDWDDLEPVEKQKRRDRFHSRKTAGKRLQVLCDNLGYGVLLLGSQTAIRNMQVSSIRSRTDVLTGPIVSSNLTSG